MCPQGVVRKESYFFDLVKLLVDVIGNVPDDLTCYNNNLFLAILYILVDRYVIRVAVGKLEHQELFILSEGLFCLGKI